MKQPSINIFGEIRKVMEIEFDRKTGLIAKVVYRVSDHDNATVFKGHEIASKSLTSKVQITKPTHHPYHNYAYAPDLESLLV
jgi:hypothetical protein